MAEIKLPGRIRTFRIEKGLSQQDLANQLGVGKITVLRWENSTSKPSPLAAEKLKEIGFGDVDPTETKRTSMPRSILLPGQHQTLRDDIRKNIQIGHTTYYFNPSSYVINGPADQLPFFETMFQLQEKKELALSESDYCRRLSLVADIPALGIRTAQNELESPKNSANHWNPNYGSHGWHRYVGRFPPHLVRSLLNYFGARSGETVCDPFSGSGTTLVESRLLGLRAVGIEICPLSCLISRTKSQFPTSVSELNSTSEMLTSFYRQRLSQFLKNRDISDVSYQEILERKGNQVDAFPNYEKWLTPEAFLGASIVIEFALTLDNYRRDFVCCALSSKMRSIGNVDVDVVRAEYRKTPRIGVDVLNHVQGAMRKMILDINQIVRTHNQLISSPDDIRVIKGSVLDARLSAQSVDYIITSPPYGVESISYLRTHLLSYRCLQPILHYDPYTFDSKAIGSEYVRQNGLPTTKHIALKYSPALANFCRGQFSESPADKDYHRRQMMVSFFDDMLNVAQLFSKWLRPKGYLAFVIGNKKIGDHIIPTDKIIAELFASCGLSLDQAINHKLKCNNSNSEVPWQERTIQDEYVMVFTKRHEK